MDLKSLLQPNGDRLKAYLYAMAYGLVGASGPLVVAVQYRDFIWAAGAVLFPVVGAVVIISCGYLVWGVLGKRVSTPVGIVIAVVIGCVTMQLCEMYVTEVLLHMEAPSEKPFLYRFGMIRGALLWWGLGAAAWYVLRRADRRDPERGRHMLDRFLDYLQAALPRVRQATAPLEEELQLAHAYLDIQQLRIGGRLAFTIEVPEDIARLRFPPLMLLTLVENAIKHGIAPQTEGGTIGIRALADESVMRIEVRDTGAGLREAAGRGMGLANVRARLVALFGAGARLVIEPNLPHGVVAAIEIPR